MRSVLPLLALAAALVAGSGAAHAAADPVPCPPDPTAALEAACPCEGRTLPSGDVRPWKNHGQYRSCTVRFRNALRRAGCLDGEQRRTLAYCAGRSTCGRPAAVVCCLMVPGTCVGATEETSGTCAHDGTPCDVDDECLRFEGRLARDEDTCDTLGGDLGDAGSVCTACADFLP
jgi:hypothetical protein